MTLKTLSRYFLLALGISMITNCTVQKRTYQKGYYVSSKKHKIRKESPNPSENKNIETSQSLLALNTNDLLNILAEKLNTNLIDFSVAKSKLNPADTCGDLITTLDSTKLQVKIIEITEDAVKYKRCDNLDGPLYTMNKNKIAGIGFSNGMKEIYAKPVRACRDSLIFINGNKMLVSIVEVTNEVVQYRSCNALKGPVSETNISNIGRIRYSDGRVVKLNEIDNKPIKEPKKASKILKLILGGILVVLLASIIIASAASGASLETLLVVLYFLFLIFFVGFCFAMGWHNVGWMPWFF